MGYRIYVARRSDGDIAFRTLCHCCIRSHMKTYPDKAVEIGETAWPSRGQAPNKTVIKGPTTWTSRTGRPGQTTKEGHGVCACGTRTAGNTRRTEDHRVRKPDDKNRTKGGEEDKRRTGGRQGQEKGKRRTRAGQKAEEDKTGHRAGPQSSGAGPRQGQEEDKRRARPKGGQEKDKNKKAWTQSWATEPPTDLEAPLLGTVSC